jgi:hypothetical protein
MITIAPRSIRLSVKAIKAAESSNIEGSSLRAIVFSPPVTISLWNIVKVNCAE